MSTKTDTATLLDKFVHTYSNSEFSEKTIVVVNRQGEIKSIVTRDKQGTPTAYEVQWMDAMGYPDRSEIVPIETMLSEGWGFYEDRETWVYNAERSWELHRYMCNRETP